jgi:thiosulfate/3-mercaptopyruvate sulfurtransferase
MSEDTVPTLVDPAWLEDRLDAPDIHILDCTVYLSTDQHGEYQLQSGYDDWADSHIPGSAFADLIEDLSETDDPDYPFQLPTPEKFAAAVGNLGISNDSRVVLYDTVDAGNNNEWAARLWWMLRVFGHDNVGVLNGGWAQWTAEDRPVSTTVTEPEPATFTANYRPELVADKDAVESQRDDDDACLINTLRPSDYAAQRIPDSENVPALGDEGVMDDDGTYQSEKALREQFADVGATDADEVITYCGSGIAAASGALGLYQAGITDAAVYDGSLTEWTADPDRPVKGDE